MNLLKSLLLFVLMMTGLLGYSQDLSVVQIYTFPFKQGDTKWREFKTAKSRIRALQIPDSLVSKIKTKQLMDICLDFPYLTDMYAFNDQNKGFDYLISEFNGFNELLKRNDVVETLLDEYEKIELAIPFLSNASIIERGNYSFRCDLLIKLIKHIEEKEGLSKDDSERFALQTERNVIIVNSYPELFCSMCKKSILMNKKNSISQNRTSWYEGEIVIFSDGRQYRLFARSTPFNSVVVAGELITSDYDDAEKAAMAYAVGQNYNVTIVAPATAKYNCHAYAWHMHEGHDNDEVWIGANSSSDEDVYWNDGSYYSVPASQATHVSYSNDHSAIRLGNGLYRSKWGALPLVDHDSLEVPTGMLGYGTPLDPPALCHRD